MSPEEIEQFISASEWTFAKTMAWCPHEYTLLARAESPELFRRFVVHIRAHGRAGDWYGTPRMYFDLGDWYYWTMGAPLDETILINRARRSDDGRAAAE